MGISFGYQAVVFSDQKRYVIHSHSFIFSVSSVSAPGTLWFRRVQSLQISSVLLSYGIVDLSRAKACSIAHLHWFPVRFGVRFAIPGMDKWAANALRWGIVFFPAEV